MTCARNRSTTASTAAPESATSPGAGRRAREHARAHELLRILLRFAVGSALIGYGVAKIIKTQFPFPGVDTLLEPYGEASPMGLLWTFMGFSTGYNIFVGLSEAGGGVLLFYRRTTTLGALILVPAMLAGLMSTAHAVFGGAHEDPSAPPRV